MRCISQYPQHMVQIRAQSQQGLGDGTIRVITEPLYAKWDPEGFIYEEEIERARRSFSFRGLLQHVDEATPIDIRTRLSLLDTEAQGWDEADRELAEAELRRLSVVTPDAFFIAEKTPIPAPFPAWDTSSLKPKALVQTLVDIGYPLNEARAYEISFGPQRPAVIEALEDAMTLPEVEVEVEIEA
jgi:hypothetical protein